MAALEVKELVQAVDACRSGYFDGLSFACGYLLALLTMIGYWGWRRYME